MELGDEGNSFSGKVPQYGAIFMSSTSTKKECLKRNIFGLPSSQAPFVAKVKVGMLLFLFEYEDRKLYGVFQAQSDGAINIAPHAYKSSGMEFPAQVTFSTIWNCSPLSEHEFKSAIAENYFSAKKFNFGLSKAQVRRLLQLFSSRRPEDQPLLRQLKVDRVTKPGHSMHKLRREVYDGSSMDYRPGDEQDMDNVSGLSILAKNSLNYLGKGRSAAGEGMFSEHMTVRNFPSVDYGHGPPAFLSDNPSKSLDEAGGAAVHERFPVSDQITFKFNVDSNVGGVELSEHDRGYLHTGGVIDGIRFNSIDSKGRRPVNDNSHRSSFQNHHHFIHSIAERGVFHGFSLTCRDDLSSKSYVDGNRVSISSPSFLEDSMVREEIVSGVDGNFIAAGNPGDRHNVDNDPRSNIFKDHALILGRKETAVGNADYMHALNYQFRNDGYEFAARPSPSIGVIHGPSSAQKPVSPYDPSDGNLFVQAEVHPDTSQGYIPSYSGPGGLRAHSFMKQSACSDLHPDSINKCFDSSQAGQLENQALGSARKDYNGASFSDFSIPTVTYNDGNCLNENSGHVSYPVGSLQGIPDNKPNSFSCGFECHENIKAKPSVFSRLTLPPKQENDSQMNDDVLNLDVSVDEIMEVLDSNHWAKMSKSESSVLQNSGLVKNPWYQKPTFTHPQTWRDTEVSPVQMNEDCCLADEVNSTEMVIPNVNFRRRSEVRKEREENNSASRSEVRKEREENNSASETGAKNDDENGGNKAEDDAENVGDKVSASEKGKRRKLVRPSFP